MGKIAYFAGLTYFGRVQQRRNQVIYKMILSFSLILLGFSAQAVNYGDFCNRDGQVTEYLCGAYPTGPGWYSGNDGCWYRNTGRYCGQVPRPNPPYPYPGGASIVRCESYYGNYQECYLGPGVQTVRVFRRYSAEPCVAYQTFGARFDRMWVSQGCRADFAVEYQR